MKVAKWQDTESWEDEVSLEWCPSDSVCWNSLACIKAHLGLDGLEILSR